jgi:hypothetical protein
MPYDVSARITRRRALALGGGLAAGGALSAGSPATGVALADRRRHRGRRGKLPADKIQEIVQAEGTVTKGVLSIDIEREDIGDVAGPLSVTFPPAFEIDGTLTFQPLGGRMRSSTAISR